MKKVAMLWDDVNDKLIYRGPVVRTYYDYEAEAALRTELQEKRMKGLLNKYPMLVEEVEL